MLLNPNKKKVALMILGSMKKKPDYVQKMGEESDTGEYQLPEEDMPNDASAGLEAAADDIISAVSKKDTRALMQALKDFIYLCDDDSEEEDDRDVEQPEYER